MSLDTTIIRSKLFAIGPKFKTSDTDELEVINGIIEIKKEDDVIESGQWGAKAEYACSLLVAHHLELIGFLPDTSTFTSVTSGSDISKRKAGNLEITYNTVKVTSNIDGNNQYTATIYGKMFLDLRKTKRFGLPNLA